MSATTRVNGSAAFVTGAIQSIVQLKAFVIDAGADIQGQVGPTVDLAIEACVREIQPLMYYVPAAGNGIVHVIVDGHAIDATTLQARIRALGTINAYDFSGATVTLGTSFVVA